METPHELRVRVLGDIGAEVDGALVAVSSPTQRLLLAALARSPGRSVPRDVLVDLVWGDRPPASAQVALKSHLSRLRRVLGRDVIESRGEGYALTLPPESVDAAQFAGRVQHAATVEHFAGALALWHGEPFAEVAEHEWFAGEARRLSELYGHARQRQAELLVADGRHDAAVAALGSLVNDEPLRETAWIALMDACTSGGRQADALAAAARYRRHVRDVGLEPSPAFVAAESAVARAEPSSPVGRGRGQPIPSPVVELVGRDREVESIGALVLERRLVSLVGPGGIGKTTLAVEVARRWVSAGSGQAHFVDLAQVDDRSGVAPAVARAVGAPTMPPIGREVVAQLSGRDVLVVIDNAEHLHAAVGAIARELLSELPSLTLLVTSRSPLDVAGETVVSVQALSAADAAELFARRARDAGVTGVRVAGELVDTICARVDRLPLAIEMAAGRLRGLSMADLAERLDAGHELLARPDDRESRHRTVHDVIAWSVDLLDEPARALLSQLSVFVGPFSLADAEAVCDVDGDVARSLADLVGHSLVHHDGGREYRLLRMVRSFGQGLLSERAARDRCVARFVDHHARLAESLATSLRSPDEVSAARRFEQIVPNLGAAHGAACTRGDVEAASRIAAAAFDLVYQRLRGELGAWAERTLSLPGIEHHQRRPAVAAVAAAAHLHTGAPDDAQRLLADLPLRPEAVNGHLVLGDLQNYRGDLDAAMASFERSGELAREAGDVSAALMADASRALSLGYAGNVTAALGLAADGHRLAASQGLGLMRAWFDYARGELLATIEPDRALPLLESVIEECTESDWQFLGGVAWLTATTIRSRTDGRAALAAYRALIEHWERRDDAVHQWTTLRNLVSVLASAGAFDAATRLLAAADAAPEPSFGAEQRQLADIRGWLARELGAGFDAAWARGARLDRSGAVRQALGAIDLLADS